MKLFSQLVLLFIFTFSVFPASSNTFKHFGKCTKQELKAGCKNNVAGYCDIFNPKSCNYQCWCSDDALSVLQSLGFMKPLRQLPLSEIKK